MKRNGHFSALASRGAALGLSGVLLAACSPKVEIVQGTCGKVRGADVCTWGEMTGKSLTAFGATVPMSAITGAPADAPMVWPPVAAATIPLPEAVTAGTGLKVLTVYFEPHGHPPKPMLIPHWDFHFYDITAADAAAIDCKDVVKPATLAAGYALPDMDLGPPIGVLPGVCVAGMGMHSLPATDLTDTTAWTKTMVIGYYHQKPIFVEPMLANATLLAKKSFTLAIPAVPGMAAGSHYPTQFRADYDSTAQSYKFVFSGFAGGAK